jgi:hypothetical protein
MTILHIFAREQQDRDFWKHVDYTKERTGETEQEVLDAIKTPGFTGRKARHQVHPSQLYGLETNVYAHELASVVVWIGYLQWLNDNGIGWPTEPILRKLDNIQNRDAILIHDTEGKPMEPVWPEAEFIIGNPPFLGGSKMRAELGGE